jgi:hypothetical protein
MPGANVKAIRAAWRKRSMKTAGRSTGYRLKAPKLSSDLPAETAVTKTLTAAR